MESSEYLFQWIPNDEIYFCSECLLLNWNNISTNPETLEQFSKGTGCSGMIELFTKKNQSIHY